MGEGNYKLLYGGISTESREPLGFLFLVSSIASGVKNEFQSLIRSTDGFVWWCEWEKEEIKTEEKLIKN